MRIFFLFLFFPFAAFAQSVHPSAIQKIKKEATISAGLIHNDWNPSLESIKMPGPGSDPEIAGLLLLKEKYKAERKIDPQFPYKVSGGVPAPSILDSFDGNPMGSGVPNDNDISISNDGKIVSVINSSIYMYDEEGTLLKNISLSAFADTLGIPASKYDPRTVYDPLHDKFVICFLSGYEPGSTNIIVGFSKTNDPTGEWNLYALPGNPKDNDKWTDFPMMAFTENELFITGNLLVPDEPWQTGFSETLIWQMSLVNGYAGYDINAVYYDSIYFDGHPIRNLCPVKGGSAPHGPDMYFLSDRNFDEANDTIFYVHVTGELGSPGTTAEIGYSIADLNYGVPPQARQYSSNTFDTNDGRVLEAFLESNQIQFVANAVNPATGYAAIYHGIISDVSGAKTIHAHIIGDDSLDFGYPDISYSGHWDGDNQSIILFDHSSPDVFAGMSAVYFNYDTYSEIIPVKEGETYVNVLTGLYERWGDYCGSQRKYNEPGTVWVSGNYGKLVLSPPFSYHNNATWIASLKSNDNPDVAVEDMHAEYSALVYPNPAVHTFHTTILLPEEGSVSIRIYDMNGNLVKDLLDAQGFPGKNVFSFNTQPLSAGNYILQFALNGEVFSTQQLAIPQP